MTRPGKQINLWWRYRTASDYLRDALIACDREAKAKNSATRRKARDEATENLLGFWFCISHIEDSLPKALRKIADALDGKLRLPQRIRYNDYIEKAAKATLATLPRGDIRKFGGPFSLRQFKQELARLYGVTPKELTKLTQRKKDSAKKPTYEEPNEKPSDAKITKLFDSSLRRTLERRGYKVSGKPGRPK